MTRQPPPLTPGRPSHVIVLSAFAFALAPLTMVAPAGVVALLLGTVLLAGLALWRAGQTPARPDMALVAAFGALLAWGALASFWGFDVVRSLILVARVGIVFAAGLLLHGFAATLDTAARARIGRWFVVGVLSAAALMAVEMALDFPLLRSILSAEKLGDDPTVALNRGAGALAMLSWPASAILWRGRAGRLAVALPAGIGLVLAFGTSAAAVLGLAAGAATAVLALSHRKAGGAILVAATLAVMIASPFAARQIYALGWHDATWLPTSAAHRVEIWNFTAQRIAEKPLLGWGFDAARAASRFPVAPPAGDHWPVALHPHNAPLQILLELGAPGGLIALVLAWIIIQRIEALPGRERIFAQALYMATLAIACTAYGLWQNQWLALMFSASALIPLTRGRTDAPPSIRHMPR